jgi:hypothetical protein
LGGVVHSFTRPIKSFAIFCKDEHQLAPEPIKAMAETDKQYAPMNDGGGIPEQRDDRTDRATESTHNEVTRVASTEHPNGHYASHATPPNYGRSNSTPHQSTSGWTNSLQRSVSENYSLYDESKPPNAPTDNIHALSSIMSKLPSHLPSKLSQSIETALANAPHTLRSIQSKSSTIANELRTQSELVRCQLKSKSDAIAHEMLASSNKYLARMEEAEVTKSALAKLPALRGVLPGDGFGYNEASGGYNCYNEKRHVGEVSFDYQLMNDVDYSSSPSLLLRQ